MDWGTLAALGKYAPFIFSEMARHPDVSAWVQHCISTMPAAAVSQVIAEAQAAAADLAKK